MRLTWLSTICTMAALAATHAHGEQANDKIYLAHPVAVDGQTLRDDSGNVYSLFAVKAPAPGRHCLNATGDNYDCGEMARSVLQVYSASVLTCTPIAPSEDSRAIHCRDFMGRDLAARMVTTGWAVPDRAVSQRYIFEEMEAAARRQGLWQGRFHSALR